MNWPTVKLKDEARLITKGTTPTTLGLKFLKEGIPFLRAQNLVDGSVSVAADPIFISPETHDALRRSKIQPSDVLISIAGTIGRAAIVPNDTVEMNCNQAVAIVRPSDRIDRRFFLHWLSGSDALAQVTQSTVTGVISNLSLGQIGNLEVPLPSLTEQRRIAAILDKADAIRRKREQALTLADNLLRSVFLEMFGDRDWPSVPLADAVAAGTIITYGIVQAGPEIDGGIPYIRTGDIKNGEIVVDGLRHTSPEVASKFTRSRVRRGEIVMSIRATVGTTAIVPPELDGANLTQGTARIAPGENTTLEYLLSHLRSQNAQAWIEGQVKGATFREITLTRLRELPVPIPPLEVQRKFSAIYQKNRSARKLLKDDAANATDLFASLSQRAFAGDL
jgi:type I restriction enzyme S subunit